jgi:glycosyltransferase involved in cell wall biosynthesis
MPLLATLPRESAMKVAFGTTLLDRGLNNPRQDGIDGIGQYCQELLHQYSHLLGAPSIAPYSFGPTQSPSGAQLLPSYSRYALGAFSHLTQESFFDNVDLIHSTDQFIPLVKRGTKPLLATVMDVIPLSHPQFLKSQSRYLKSFLWKKLTQRADRIITISEFSKGEITKYLGFSPDRIDVIPLGVDQRYFAKISDDQKKLVLQELGIKTPFFLFLGSIQPRKNLLGLLEAHARLPKALAREYPLVIAGKLAWDDGNTLAAINKAVSEGRARWLNYISEEQKLTLLQSAMALVFVSLYEGFGLPIVEAFASKLPVMTSNCTSMPEVAGNAALIIDPCNQKQMTDALLALIEDAFLVEKLKVAGLERTKQFSWQGNAEKTLSIYRSMV